jgi:predicted nucleic acid-binding protein
MASEFLIDANVLIYAVDRSDLGKRETAFHLVEQLRSSGSAALSTQILAEFFSSSTRRIGKPLKSHDALRMVIVLSDAFTICDITLPVVLEAARAAAEHQMSYWDAQVWATAKLNQIPFVLSEDLQGWESLEGVRFLNPFAKGFSLPTSGRR